jgi:uncharacterized iron-regulated membrane protein
VNLVILAAIVGGLVLWWGYLRKLKVQRTDEQLPQRRLEVRDIDTRTVVIGVVGLLVVVGLALVTSGVIRR